MLPAETKLTDKGKNPKGWRKIFGLNYSTPNWVDHSPALQPKKLDDLTIPLFSVDVEKCITCLQFSIKCSGTLEKLE